MHKLALFLLFVLPTALLANFPDYYEGSIELLYFKPTIDQSFYVINSDNTVFQGQHLPNGTRFNNDPFFQPAFRLDGLYGFCDGVHELDLRFACFNETHSDTTSGAFLFDAIGFPGDGAQTPEDTVYNGSAKYKQHFNYYALDATYNRISSIYFPENFTFFLGLHFAYLKVQEKASSDGTSDDTTAPTIANRFTRSSHFWGLGPEFGIDYCYLLSSRCGPLILGTNARVALLASHTSANLQYLSTRTGPVGVNLNNQPLWRVIPSIDVKVGLAYKCPFRCLNITYELGYELIWYSNAVDAITGYDVAFAGDTIDLFSSFNLQGPYFSIKALF